MHGGKSTGPKTAQGIEAIRKAHLKHGRRSAEAIALRRTIAAILGETRQHVTECRKAFDGGIRMTGG
jgi:hypothetical protein